MSSRFARHGTTGYRWPKVCISTPREPPPTPPPVMPTTTIYIDWTINDAIAPFSSSATHVPLTRSGTTQHWVFTGLMNGVTNIDAQIGDGIAPGGPTGFNTTAGAYSTMPPPNYTVGLPYDSGNLVVQRPFIGPVGTCRIYS